MKIVPSMNFCSPARITFSPTSSVGVVSGVNWTRLKSAPSTYAVARPSSVFAVPGGPSRRT